ncbi:MAG: hypothetical protein COU81_01235 [Candidatus Portnoybacteria bacterium CG10_big_fil_rev_8_21_14_0_10_36_7]|uniref:Uncharacterized protein n=1 Tax=Candidatus Portnoybacteria bacterium CG10_big_fil_rev_8_21_14_0_10_36_7 TaxID=1974812 RepID=A0A2M8KEL9_9BACT|nr:MAG: hypothetical protein COU81_01235 [Candidatus Portnoybacteria bacterium CG10_big_fil_rev_8_21_14_0_10_36_7]
MTIDLSDSMSVNFEVNPYHLDMDLDDIRTALHQKGWRSSKKEKNILTKRKSQHGLGLLKSKVTN